MKDSNMRLTDEIKGWLASLTETELENVMSFNFQQDSPGSSHDYDLIKEMIHLQPQHTTPIHPSAMGVKLASHLRSTDGRQELDRMQHNRFQRPRLFQLIEESKSMSAEESCIIFSSMPPEIAALVRSELKSSTFKTSNDTKKIRYEVIARKFELPWGEQLSIAPTEDMRLCDYLLLVGTNIQTGCQLSDSGLFQILPSCVFRKTDMTFHILDILKVCSRGRSFSKAPNHEQGFFAPWFQPKKEWFSLSTYLASRFEHALWETYRKYSENRRILYDIPKTTIEQFRYGHSAEEWHICIHKALRDSIISCLLDTSKLGNILIRDSTLFRLSSSDTFMKHLKIDMNTCHMIRLMDIDGPIDQFRKIFLRKLETCISQVAEKDLLSSLPQSTLKSKSKQKQKKHKRTVPLKKLSSIDEKSVDRSISIPSITEFRMDSGNSLSKERNKNTVIVMSILQDIYTNVFLISGDGSDKNDDGFQLAYGKKKDKTNKPHFYLLHKAKNVHSFGSGCHSETIVTSKSNSTYDIPVDDETIELNQMTLKRNNLSVNIWEAFPAMNEITGNDIRYDFQKLFAAPHLDDSDKVYFDISSTTRDTTRIDDALIGVRQFMDHNITCELYDDRYENNFASSTAASIASSILDNTDDIFLRSVPTDHWENDSDDLQKKKSPIIFPDEEIYEPELSVEVISTENSAAYLSDCKSNSSLSKSSSKRLSDQVTDPDSESKSTAGDVHTDLPNSIQLSLADFGELRKRVIKGIDSREDSSLTTKFTTVKRSFSREDLRLQRPSHCSPKRKLNHCSAKTVDHSVHSYKNVLSRSRSVSSNDVAISKIKKRALFDSTRSLKSLTNEVIIDGHFELNACAQSESALDVIEDSSHFNVIPTIEVGENDDSSNGGTTISSIPAHDFDDVRTLLEERNAYRDMCLTLASENSKLKNILALERINLKYKQTHPQSYVSNAHAFDSRFVPPYFHNRTSGTLKRYIAMSDAGINEMQMSEDGSYFDKSVAISDMGSKQTINTKDGLGINTLHRMKTGKTGEFEEEPDNTAYTAFVAPHSIYRDSGPAHFHGLQSRLSNDIMLFVESVDRQLYRQESRKRIALKRLTTLITTIWPRAQVKLYGSVQTNLRLPSSDLDIVICLPNVHKDALAEIAGNLEGRNAINESNQKLLARKLKSESWVEMRSIQIIEHTVIPVIKVATKDSRSKSLHLDISFDSDGHHGLEAVQMVTKMLDEIPTIRPLVLVLKRFLSEKGLLTAYTGGLSSYGLFLLVTRYLQEQKSSWVDVGSLLSKFS